MNINSISKKVMIFPILSMNKTSNESLIAVSWILSVNRRCCFWNRCKSSRKGIVQDLNRISMLGTLSHIRRLSYPLPAGSKTIGHRKLHNSQWGFVCPSESPDGGNVGIINHLTIMVKVSINIDPTSIYQALLDVDMKPISGIHTSDLNMTGKIFLNGTFVGIHDNLGLVKKF